MLVIGLVYITIALWVLDAGKRILLCGTWGPIRGLHDFAREKNTKATIFVPSADDPLSFKTP